MATIRRADLEDALVEADFPADKDRLLAHAAKRRASPEILQSLRSLQPVTYGSLDEVVSSVHAKVLG